MLRRILLLVLFATLLVYAGFRIHDRQLPRLDMSPSPHVLGAFHVHSAASHDGKVPLETIARTVRRLGLDFVVVTDHNNQLAGPIFLDGVTVLSYAELSTPFGHVIQLGAGRLLQKQERAGIDVLDRIRDLGGAPVAAHPSDAKRPWNGPVAQLGGFELANYESSARRRGGPIFVGLLPSLLSYRLNQPLALAQVYDRDDRTLARWDGESSPHVVGLCGTDAHGTYLPLEPSLRTWLVALEAPLPQERDQRPEAVLDALRRGRFHCVAGLFGKDPSFSFDGFAGEQQVAAPGDDVRTADVDALVVQGPESKSDPPTIVLLRNGQEVARSDAPRMRYPNPMAGTYRVEVRIAVPDVLFGYRVVPVIYSNRIRVGDGPLPQAEASPP